MPEGYDHAAYARMTSPRWQQIERLFHEALARGEADRSAFLREACAGDEALRREVESLLAQDRSRFLERPAFDMVDEAKRMHRSEVRSEERASEPLPIWARVMIAVAAVRTAVALVLYLSAGQAPLRISTAVPHPPLPPVWIYAALSGTFTALGLGLVVGSRRDTRAEWLGGFLTLTAAPLATVLMQSTVIVPPQWLAYVRPEALGAATLWHFLARFPTDLEPRASRVVRRVATATGIIGLWCFAANLVAVLFPSSTASPSVSLFLISRPSLYWLVIAGMTAPAFPVLFARARWSPRAPRVIAYASSGWDSSQALRRLLSRSSSRKPCRRTNRGRMGLPLRRGWASSFSARWRSSPS